MKRGRLLVILLFWSLVLGACTMPPDSPAGETPSTATGTVAAPAVTVTAPPATPTPPLPTTTATVVPSPTATAAPATTDLALQAEDIFVYPVPHLYSGDSATFQILTEVPEQIEPGDVAVEIQIEERLTLQGSLNGRSLSGKPVGLFTWAWETQGELGDYQITVTLDPEDEIQVGDANQANNQVTLTIPVLPASTRPAQEKNAAWITVDSSCCTLHVVNGTAAHRDLNQLKELADRAFQHAAQQLDVQPQQKFDLYLIDRVIGQGGYAGSNMVVSYLDRNYVGGGVYEVVEHEAVHLLDRTFAPDRIPFLAEGLAVWVTGGHYKQEPINARAAALRETNLYIPLPELVANFYEYQHEIGYLEAAGFVGYLIERYGWERARVFYSEVSTGDGQTAVEALDTQLRSHFGQSLAEFESDWVAYLEALPPDPTAEADLLTTIRYYDVVRDYQLKYDPTAHFLQAWLPFPQELEQRQLTAELTRHPSDEINVTMEVMLYAVDQAIRAGDHSRATVILDSVERALANDGQFRDPLGTDYQRIVQKLTGVGYEVHQVDIRGTRATAQVTEGRRIYLRPVGMVLRNQAWILLN